MAQDSGTTRSPYTENTDAVPEELEARGEGGWGKGEGAIPPPPPPTPHPPSPIPHPRQLRPGIPWQPAVDPRRNHILQARPPQTRAERGQILRHEVREPDRSVRDPLPEQVVHRRLFGGGRDIAAVLRHVRLQRREPLEQLRRVAERVLPR